MTSTPATMTLSVPTWREVLRPGLAAIGRFWKPFVLIQSAALALVLGYFFSETVREWCGTVSAVQSRGGVLFAALASAFAGAILPELAKIVTRLHDKPVLQRLHDVAFNALFFAISGLVVYYFYALQAVIFGDDAKVSTIVAKVAVDQIVFAVLWAVPYSLFMYTWKAAGYDLRETFADLTPRRLLVRVPSMLLPIWAFWIPMVTMIYALPADLQFALFSLSLAAWSLLVVFIAGQR
jgi:hypothetical protein